MNKLMIKLKDGNVWTAMVSIAFIVSALVIFIVDQVSENVSYPYIISAMVCIYLASVCLFGNVIATKLKTKEKRYLVTVIILAVVEVAVLVFTAITLRRFAVAQYEQESFRALNIDLNNVTVENVDKYAEYLEYAERMNSFYLNMGILFMLWWVSPIALHLIRFKHNDVVEPKDEVLAVTEDEEE